MAPLLSATMPRATAAARARTLPLARRLSRVPAVRPPPRRLCACVLLRAAACCCHGGWAGRGRGDGGQCTWFVIDLLSTLPFHRMVSSADVDQSVLRLSKFIRLLKLFKLVRLIRTSHALMRRIQQSQLAYVAHPAIIRIFYLILGLTLSWHVIGCLWWFLRSDESAVRASLTRDGHEAVHMIPLPSNGTWDGLHYIESYYWAVSVTTGIGVPVLPLTHEEVRVLRGRLQRLPRPVGGKGDAPQRALPTRRHAQRALPTRRHAQRALPSCMHTPSYS